MWLDKSSEHVVAAAAGVWSTATLFAQVAPAELSWFKSIAELTSSSVIALLLCWIVVKFIPGVLKDHRETVAAMAIAREKDATAMVDGLREFRHDIKDDLNDVKSHITTICKGNQQGK